MNEVPIKLLKPHAKNREYFSEPTSEEKETLRRSIAAHGIRDPLKVLPDYTVLAGHVRLEIAKELGMTHVPVVVYDLPLEEAEYLLIADNDEKRHSDDPIKKAKRAKFLKEYWKVKRGNNQWIHQNGESKTSRDIARVVGVNAKHLNRLLKLNDLIPELQALVSSGKLGTTAAEQLAYLSPDT